MNSHKKPNLVYYLGILYKNHQEEFQIICDILLFCKYFTNLLYINDNTRKKDW